MTQTSSFDEHCMDRALTLAKKGEGLVEPNPMVGCVLAKAGEIIGEGFHEQFGGPHAEVNALSSVSSTQSASQSTAYVTLEPCCHHGKTPPCTEALIQAGVQRVVIATEDPFPKVSGGGIQQLRDQGVDVQVGVCQDRAIELLAPYLKRIRTGAPWTIAKWAMTIDGRIATNTGESQWITGEDSRASVHQLRSRVDAILTGMGTVQSDDPLLTARLSDREGNPLEPKRIATRVVLCRSRVPSTESRLVRSAREIPLLLAIGESILDPQVQPLVDAGAEVFRCGGDDSTFMVTSLLNHLGKRQTTNVMIEGGSQILGSFFPGASHDSTSALPGNCLIDEVHIYIGPKLFGGTNAPGPLGGPGIERILDSPEFLLKHHETFGNDLHAVYRKR